MRKRNVIKHGVVAVMLSSTLMLATPITAQAKPVDPLDNIGTISTTTITDAVNHVTPSTDAIIKRTLATLLQKAEQAEKEAAEAQAKKEAEAKKAEALAAASSWTGPKLTRSAGTVQGPSGKETYYNLPMQGVIDIMRRAGYSEAEYPYHVREDGVKMLGPYIMVAANLSLRPRGTIYQTSLGQAIVCDTGGFASGNPTQTDIAVSW